MRTKDENKRKAIYHAAMDIINTIGLENASMSKIAKTAGVSKSTIYIYFKNKQDMLNKLYLTAKEESALVLFAGFSSSMDIKIGLALYMRNLFKYILENPIKYSFQKQFDNSPNIDPETRNKGIEIYTPIIHLFSLSVEKEIVKKYPFSLIRAFVVAPINSLATAHHKKEIEVTEEIIEKTIEMTWLAIKAGKG